MCLRSSDLTLSQSGRCVKSGKKLPEEASRKHVRYRELERRGNRSFENTSGESATSAARIYALASQRQTGFLKKLREPSALKKLERNAKEESRKKTLPVRGALPRRLSETTRENKTFCKRLDGLFGPSTRGSLDAEV